jgi:hypothetical protein
VKANIEQKVRVQALIHMYGSGKMRLVEIIPGMGERE